MGDANVVHFQEFPRHGCLAIRSATAVLWEALLIRIAGDFPYSCVVVTDGAATIPFG